jgi:hypothetical protein
MTMGAAAPPHAYDGQPNRFMLRRGTCLWRVHAADRRPSAFKSLPSSTLFGGGRFDSTPEDKYPFFYAGLEEETALAEVLVRDLPSDERGVRVIPWVKVARQRFAGVVVTADLSLVRLMNGIDLAAIGQDAWLLNAAGSEYAQTRGWAHWLRATADWAHGLAWSSQRNLGGTSIILFGDRCAATFGSHYENTLLHEVPSLAINLYDKSGADWLNERLKPFRVGIAHP